MADVAESDFVTQGPELVDYILRDPPGSQSFAERTVGTTTTTETSWEWNVGGGVDINTAIFGGTQFNLGIGYSTSTEIEATVNIGLSTSTSGGEGQTTIETITNEDTWATSSDPLLAGAGSDLFIGTSRNFLFGVSTNVQIVPDSICTNSKIECHGTSVNGYRLAATKNLAIAGGDFQTEFIFTAAHIETSEIPTLEKLRNNFLEGNPLYTIRETDTSSPCYGANNDDPRWEDGTCTSTIPASPEPMRTTAEDFSGPSYIFNDPLAGMPDTASIDSVRFWNQQIRLWQEALAFNEEQKANVNESDTLNISYNGGGASFTRSVTNSSSFTQSRTFEFNFSESLAFKVGGKVAGAGFDDNYSVSLNQNRTEVNNETTENTHTVSFTISDDSEWDDFTIDIFEGSNSGGPIFKVLGGQSSCPHEGQVVSKYYEPGTVLNPGTIQLEQPEISIVAKGSTSPILRNVPQDESGVFQMTIKNNNQVGEAWEYATQLIAETNPYSLSVNVGSSDDLTRTWVVPAQNSITRDVFVDIGTEYDNEDVLVVVHSTCQYQQGLSVEPDIVDSAYFSIFFIPECSAVEIATPTDQWITNNSFKDTMEIEMEGYDINHLNFHTMAFQYKSSSESDASWTTQQMYAIDSTGMADNPNALPIPLGTFSTVYDWDISSLPDGEYDLRAVTTCASSTTVSEVHRGFIDRQNPAAFGTPSPADGILDPEDDVIIRFNEPIDPAYVSDFNIDVRGRLNGTALRQQESLGFDGVDDYGTIPEYQLQGRSFTVEFWAKRSSSGEAVVLSQGTSADDQLVVGYNTANTLYIKLQDKVATANMAIADSLWHFYQVAYDSENREVKFYIDSDPVGDPDNFNAAYSSTGPLIVGRDSRTMDSYFEGNLQELRLWSTVEGPAGGQASVSLSGREPGLIGNWPMDESFGSTANEKVRSRHMVLEGPTWNVDPPTFTYAFDGMSDYLIAEDAGTLGIGPSEDLTIEGWFKTGSNGQKKTILSNGVPSATTPALWAVSVLPSGKLVIENNGESLSSSIDVDDDSWHHFSLVLERGFAISLYIDGQLNQTTNASLFADLGGPHLVLGAQLMGGGFTRTFSQYFDGLLDDVRIWKLARRPEQVSRDFIYQMTGDEPGLLAYYPFDEYDLIDPQPMPTLEGRAIADSLFTLTANGGNFSNIRPTLKLPRRIKKVPFNHLVNGDELFIDLDIQPSEIENVTLDFTVSNIRDFSGNIMKADETWIAYINKNQVFWDTEYFNFEKKLEDPLSFTATIRNTGGRQESYTIGNLPSWLTASPSAGLIDPNSSVDITFSVQPLLNIGEYEQDVFVSTQSFGFNERMLIDLKVIVDPPDWVVHPDDFSHSMNIVGELRINESISIDEEDIVSVWVDDEIRGVAHVEFDPTSGKHLLFLTVLSNATSGETLEFRAWDASSGRLLTGLMPDDIAFIGGGILNSRGNPMPISATVLTELTYTLNPGWNWISFPLDDDLLADVDAILADLPATDNDEVKYLGKTNLYAAGSWQGNLGGFDTDKGYKVRSATGGTFKYEGTFVDPSTDPIDIVPGWNWIGVKSEFIVDVASAMSSLDPQTGDVIKGQRSFAIYEEGFGWGGNLDFLVPQKGYMLKYHSNDQLFYQGNINTSQFRPSDNKSRAIKTAPVAVVNKVGYTVGQYSSTMSLSAEISECIGLAIDGQVLDLSQWSLAAFVGDECRGVESAVYVPSLEKYIFYLSIEGSGAASLDFRLVHNTDSQEIALEDKITFAANEVVGSSLNPFAFTCVPVNDCGEMGSFLTTDIDLSANVQDYQVRLDLVSDARLSTDKIFRFKAGRSIQFLEQFEVAKSTTLEAYIEDCLNSN